MKLLKDLLLLLLSRSKAPKIFCMFDNMEKDNRLTINALCEYDPLEEWATWKQGKLLFPHLLRKLVKYSPNAPSPKSYTRIVYVKYKGRRLKIDLSTGDILRPLKNIKFDEGAHTVNGFDLFNHHTTSTSLLLHRRTEIVIPSIGKIILHTQNRALNIELNDDSEKSLRESSFRGALVSELCACEIPQLSTILPLTKTPGEIDYANSVLQKRWEKEIEKHEQWKNNEDSETRGSEPPRAPGQPPKVDW